MSTLLYVLCSCKSLRHESAEDALAYAYTANSTDVEDFSRLSNIAMPCENTLLCALKCEGLQVINSTTRYYQN